MSDSKTNVLETLGAATIAVIISPLLILLLAPLMLLRGWVLSILWGWFVVPVFGLPVLGVLQAVGLALVISFITPTNWSRPKNKTVEWIYPFIAPIMSLILGYMLHWWM